MPLPGDMELPRQGEVHYDGAMIGGQAFIVHVGKWRYFKGNSPRHEVIDLDRRGRRGEGSGAVFLGKNGKARGLESCERFRLRFGIEVACQDDGVFAFGEAHYEIVYLRYPEGFPGPVVVNTDKGEKRTGSGWAHHDFQCTAWFRSRSELMTNGFLDREAREDRQPVLTSLKVHELSEPMMHAKKSSQGRSLIDLSGASTGVIDFLKGYQVRLEFAEHGCDSLQVHLAVHASTVLDVVGNQSDRGGFCRLERGAACEEGTGDQKETGQRTEQVVMMVHFGVLFYTCFSALGKIFSISMSSPKSRSKESTFGPRSGKRRETFAPIEPGCLTLGDGRTLFSSPRRMG